MPSGEHCVQLPYDFEILSLYFPNLERIEIRNNPISVDICSTWSNENIKYIVIDTGDKQVNILEIMSVLHSSFPSVNNLCIRNCDLRFDSKCKLGFLLDPENTATEVVLISFHNCSYLLNIDQIILGFYTANTNVLSLEFSECSLIFPYEPDEGYSADFYHFKYIMFKNCSFEPDCIETLIKCSNDVTVIIGDKRMRLFYQPVPDNSIFYVDVNSDCDDVLLNVFDVETVHLLFPFSTSIGFLAPLENFSLDAVKDIEFPSTEEFRICNWHKRDNNLKIINVIALCCPFVTSLEIADSQIALDERVPGLHQAIKTVRLRRCNNVHFSNLLKFLSSCCPSTEFILLEECNTIFYPTHSCGDFDSTVDHMETLQIVSSEKRLDMTDVILTLESTLSDLRYLVLRDSHVSFSPDKHINTQRSILGTVCCSNCTFSPKVLEFMLDHCSVLMVGIIPKVLSLKLSITKIASSGRKIIAAVLESDQPIDKSDVTNLLIWCPSIHELTLCNIIRLQENIAQSVEQYFWSLRSISFHNCNRELDVSLTLANISVLCRHVSSFTVVNSPVKFSNGVQIKLSLVHVTLAKCKSVNFSEVMSFVMVSCPTVKYMTIHGCDLKFDSKKDIIDYVFDATDWEIIVSNCTAPEDFPNSVSLRYPSVDIQPLNSSQVSQGWVLRIKTPKPHQEHCMEVV